MSSVVDDARPDRRLASIPGTTEILGGISRSRVYELLAAGELEAVKIGSRRLVVVASIDAYVERLRADGGPDAA